MKITRTHHVSFTVSNLERTVEFYRDVLGLPVLVQFRNKYDTLGEALFGDRWGINQKQADLKIAFVQLPDIIVELIEYVDPKVTPYHKNPSVAGSAHLCFQVDDVEGMKKKLEAAGVEFHSEVHTVHPPDQLAKHWVYFRDPDGIVLEFVQVEGA